MTLYEIDKAILDLLENGFNGTVDEETGEIIDDGKSLEELQMERTEKIESIALYIKSLDSLAEDIKKEEDALKERRQKREAKAERLREYLAASMTEDKFESARVAISFRKSKAVIVDEEKLDKAYFKETVTVKTAPDKTAIKKAIEAGETVTGAYIENRKKVQIV